MALDRAAAESGRGGLAVSEPYDDLWAAVPDKAMHETRVAMIEALWWIEEPVSSSRFVNIFDGQLGSQWEILHHLEVLRRLGVVELVPEEVEKVPAKFRKFFLPYRLLVP